MSRSHQITVLLIGAFVATLRLHAGVWSPGSDVEGRSVSEWFEDGMRIWLETPASRQDCLPDTAGKVYPLVEPQRASPFAVRSYTCQVPAGRPILVALQFNGSATPICFDCNSCLLDVQPFVDQVTRLELEIDNDIQISSQELLQHRVAVCFGASLPPNNRLGWAPGHRSPIAVDGYAVILRPLEAGVHEITYRHVKGPDQNPNEDVTTTWHLEVVDTGTPARSFRRGDCNDDGTVDVTDPIATLFAVFLGQFDIPCDDACDSNDDGGVDVSDAIATLGALFLGQGSIPLPGFTECGSDPTDDSLECDDYDACR